MPSLVVFVGPINGLECSRRRGLLALYANSPMISTIQAPSAPHCGKRGPERGGGRPGGEPRWKDWRKPAAYDKLHV